MNNRIKNLINILQPEFVQRIREELWIKKKIAEWKKNGRFIPPPDIVKQDIICSYQKKSKYSIFIETGTYKGDMVQAQKRRFKKIISIELGVDLFEKAQKRFDSDENITIIQGDSGNILPEILIYIDKPVIFWLDGHYSGGITAQGKKVCPIFEEIDAIFQGMKFDHILLIDDARDFNGFGDYPTIENLSEYIVSKNINYQIEVKDDIIRCKVKSLN
ncbi:MAG: hypothetical protein PHT07_10950 [Paludibacter sp.]|nr:hypothetical protein [Paludibacter sp.]